MPTIFDKGPTDYTSPHQDPASISNPIYDTETGEILDEIPDAPQAIHSFYVPHARVTLDCGTELITKQSHKDECDINTILYQYSKQGILLAVEQNEQNYIDLPEEIDFHHSLNVIMEAETAFNALPSLVREHYNNSPAEFLSAIHNPDEADYLRSVGVLRPASESVGGGTPPPEPEPAPPAS